MIKNGFTLAKGAMRVILLPAKRTAFTLAEILITLGIIGIVAAMTIPTLVSNYRKKQLEAQIKATYSTIQQALRFAEYEDISYTKIPDGDTEKLKEWFDSFLGKHLKVEQLCINYATRGCWHQIKNLKGQNWGSSNGIGYNIIQFTLAKGATVNLDGNSSLRSWGIDTDGSGMIFIFDANGDVKPNTLGKDVFIMAWTEKGLVPVGSDKTKEEIKTECETGTGYWCLNEVIENGWTIPDKIWKRTK